MPYTPGVEAARCQKDNLGWTAFHFAAANGHLEVIKILMKHFAPDWDLENLIGQSALQLAELNEQETVLAHFQPPAPEVQPEVQQQQQQQQQPDANHNNEPNEILQNWPGADLLGIEDIEGIEIGVGIAAEMEEDIEIFE